MEGTKRETQENHVAFSFRSAYSTLSLIQTSQKAKTDQQTDTQMTMWNSRVGQLAKAPLDVITPECYKLWLNICAHIFLLAHTSHSSKTQSPTQRENDDQKGQKS